MSVCPDGVMLSANEVGVSAADVVALCSMGASTKTGLLQTGRKGEPADTYSLMFGDFSQDDHVNLQP